MKRSRSAFFTFRLGYRVEGRASTARQARGPRAVARQARGPSAAPRFQSFVRGRGTQIFKIEKYSKRILPKFVLLVFMLVATKGNKRDIFLKMTN